MLQSKIDIRKLSTLDGMVFLINISALIEDIAMFINLNNYQTRKRQMRFFQKTLIIIFGNEFRYRFYSPQLKGDLISSTMDLIYELLYELPKE